MSVITLGEILRMKREIREFKLDLLSHRMHLAYKFHSDQSRDERGRWSETGGSADTREESESALTPILAAARRRRGVEAECKLQYERDLFQCRMVGISQCYHQAMVRFIACEEGRSVPPLNY